MSPISILALVEQAGGVPDRLSLEMLALAREVSRREGSEGGGSGGAGAVLFGEGAPEAATGLAYHGVSSAIVVRHDDLDDYSPAAWAASLEQLMAVTSATLVMGPGSDRGSEVLAHLAARLGLAMAANCTDVHGGDPFRITRQRWAGSLLEDATLEGPVRLLTVAAHAVEPAPAAQTEPIEVSPFTPVLTESDLVVKIRRRSASDAGRISLTDARVVVGGGRGVGSAAGFADLEELAALLGGAVGVSRAVTSAGWRPHAEQVGQTGLRIAPDLYIACGISGAIQHIVGCKAAKHILAINSDPDAPIMEKADTAVIGDLRTIVPAINAEIRRTR